MLFFIIALHRSSTSASCGQPVQNVGGAGGNKGGRESGGGEGPRRGGRRRVYLGLFHKMNAAQKEEALKGYVICNRVSFRTVQGGGGISRVY